MARDIAYNVYIYVKFVNMDARTRIISEAIEVFLFYGFRQTSMELLAERLGLTRQAVYRHFRNKRDLLRAGADWLHAQALEAAEKAVAANADAPMGEMVSAALDARFSHILSRLSASPHSPEILEEQNAHCGDITEDYAERFVAMLGDAIARKLEADGLRLCDGLDAHRLARYCFLAARAIKSVMPFDHEAFRAELALLTGLIVRGALAERD